MTPVESDQPNRPWTPPPPARLLDHLDELEPGAGGVLWAVWCVPQRYQLTPGRWRVEARMQTSLALKAKVRRLIKADLLRLREVRGPGLVFDGQSWQPRRGGKASFWELRLTSFGEDQLRVALRRCGAAIRPATAMREPSASSIRRATA